MDALDYAHLGITIWEKIGVELWIRCDKWGYKLLSPPKWEITWVNSIKKTKTKKKTEFLIGDD